MDKNEARKKIEKFSELVENYISPYKIILYGSYAKGNFNENSDIDVAIVVEKLDDDFLDVSQKLYKLRREVDDNIEPVLFELNNDPSGFLEDILEYGEEINYKWGL